MAREVRGREEVQGVKMRGGEGGSEASGGVDATSRRLGRLRSRSRLRWRQRKSHIVATIAPGQASRHSASIPRFFFCSLMGRADGGKGASRPSWKIGLLQN